MGQVEANIAGREVSKRTETITDNGIADLIGAFGNSEAKAITLLVLSDGEPHTRGELKTAVTSMQGGKNCGWDIDSANLDAYCSQRMEKVGLVDQDDGPPRTYIISQYGAEVAVPLAGLLLDFSLKHPEISLYELFGPANTTSRLDKRSPLTRLRILRALANIDSDTRKKDLMDLIHDEKDVHIIGLHLRSLDKSRIVKYNAAALLEPIVHVRMKDDCPPDPIPLKTHKGFSLEVFEILRQHMGGNLTIDGIITLLPDQMARQKRARSSVSVVLTYFERMGYVTKADGYSKLRRTSLIVPPEMKQIIQELLSIVDRLKQGDPEIIEQGNKIAAFFQSRPDQVACLMEKAREASHHAR